MISYYSYEFLFSKEKNQYFIFQVWMFTYIVIQSSTY